MGERAAEIKNQIKAQALAVGFHKVGIASPEVGFAVAHLRRWLRLGYHADMLWMANPKRQDLHQVLPGIQSVICLALNYYTPHAHAPDRPRISRYGWGRDYHRVLGKRLKQLCAWLNQNFPDSANRYYVDTGPIPEKVLAQQAGLGWIGKNGNVISREYGSWVFLGEILTTLPLPPDAPHPDRCGTCTRCLAACPTQAIVAPYVVDANRCLAYHTIENRAVTLPPAIAQNLERWVAGCDICQEVCPWNQRFAQPTEIPDFQPYPGHLQATFADLCNLSIEEWQQRFPGSALRRIKPEALRRNAIAAFRSFRDR
ncbi:MAG TPA: tRNA epoxyqueuosine(34) reductase QueG [Cyanobacteria bacterium UBA8156]|jgi:epoxyqueuosine reductase|nr:tRNA epoxyqueuosine(34) reductase QueG [Cyanobacteria bacterium UBA8156]